MRAQLLAGLRAVVVLTVLCGLAFPLFVTLVARVAFDDKADGSLVRRDGVVVGSTLIGQTFTQPGYFHGRPSAAGATAAGARRAGSARPHERRIGWIKLRADESPVPQDRRRPRAGVPRGERARPHDSGTGGRGHRVRIGARSADLGRKHALTAHVAEARGPGRRRACAHRRAHGSSLARVPRREGCERPRPESRVGRAKRALRPPSVAQSKGTTMDVEEGKLARTMGMAIGAIGPIVVAGALAGVRDSVANADVALLLVLVVVLATVTGGWQAGAVGAVVAALSFDFFHTKPYLSLTMDSRDDVEPRCSSSWLASRSASLPGGRARREPRPGTRAARSAAFTASPNSPRTARAARTCC